MKVPKRRFKRHRPDEIPQAIKEDLVRKLMTEMGTTWAETMESLERLINHGYIGSRPGPLPGSRQLDVRRVNHEGINIVDAIDWTAELLN